MAEARPRRLSSWWRRCCASRQNVAGVAFVIEIFFVSALTLVITATVSNRAIHTSGVQLASTLVDTVAERVDGYILSSEQLVMDVGVTTRLPGYMLPSDDDNATWYHKWSYGITTRFAIAHFEPDSVVVITHDGGLVVAGTWWKYPEWFFSYATDPRTLVPYPDCWPCTEAQHTAWRIARGHTEIRNLATRNKRTLQDWDPAVQGAPSFAPLGRRDERASGYMNLLGTLGKGEWCTWLPPYVSTITLPGAFKYNLGCTVHNSSGHLLGVALTSQGLDAAGRFLADTKTTVNTHMIIVDNKLLLVASTVAAPYERFYAPTNSTPSTLPAGCMSSLASSSYTPERIGCRSSVEEYPYAPLRAVAESNPSFLKTPKRVEEYGTLAGATYFYISLRIASRTTTPFSTMNLILFLPEADVIGDSTDGITQAVLLCIAVCLTSAVLAVLIVRVLMQASSYDRFAQQRRSEEARRKAAETTCQDVDSSTRTVERLDVAAHTYTALLTSLRRASLWLPSTGIAAAVDKISSAPPLSLIPAYSVQCTILVLDIRGFQAISDRIDAAAMLTLLRRATECVCDVIRIHHGYVDKLIGDLTVSVFVDDCHEARAMLCGLAIDAVSTNSTSALANAFATHGETLRFGVAGASGVALTIGCETADGGAESVRVGVGALVSRASKLLSVNDDWGTALVFDEATVRGAPQWFATRHVVSVSVDLLTSIKVYEVLGVVPSQLDHAAAIATWTRMHQRTYLLADEARAVHAVTERHIQWARRYEAAMRLFEQGRDGPECRELLRDALADAPSERSRVSVVRLLDACLTNDVPSDLTLAPSL